MPRPPPPVKLSMKQMVRGYKDHLKTARAEADEKLASTRWPKENIGNFEILGTLGEGSFGTVILAMHRQSRKLFAVKVLSSRMAEICGAERALLEKRVLFATHSDFIVPLFFSGHDRTNLYLFMEFVPRGTLKRCFCENSRQPEATVKLYAAQIVLALEYLHACRILYRDLKPDNVLLADDNYIKLCDFGLAKRIQRCTYTVVGHRSHIPPEVTRRLGYREGTDWWAFGVTVYELLFQKLPYSYTDPAYRGVNVPVIPIVFPPEAPVSVEVHDLILSLLEKDPTRRLGTLERGTEDVKEHPWFAGLSFPKLFHKSIPMPNFDYPETVPIKKIVYRTFFHAGEVGPAAADIFEDF
ncbi:cAMP-dependent protein kinase catalytic subunit-like [Galendromus occidentalis]|uniref:cAMP-dependent protein kinase catalytic subunit-like n=1 Tax=Galendromus occidentalis TaxID=34638 RepID=A0AAJ6QK16_9ACAR|nr:cAMP-dependent protein kinase catalytic subunit-like [Galendromus occidentalis]